MKRFDGEARRVRLKESACGCEGAACAASGTPPPEQRVRSAPYARDKGRVPCGTRVIRQGGTVHIMYDMRP